MQTRLAVFDLDGTLLNTLQDLADSMNAVLGGRGFPEHPVDAYRYFVGNGVGNLVRRALPGDDPDEALVEECVAAMGKEYSARWADTTAVYPGVEDLLDGLEGRGIAVAVLSNKPDDLTVKTVDHFFPGRRFLAVRGAREGVPRKPDPAGAYEILKEANLSAALAATSAIYAGDTATDMHTARAAGIPVVGVLWGFRPRSELEGAGADWIVAEPREIRAIVDGGEPLAESRAVPIR